MIRVSISSKNNQVIQQLFEKFFQKEQLEYQIVSYSKNTHQDIYIFEIHQREDLKLIEEQPHFDYALYYVIGPKDYDLISECMRLKVNLYFSKESLTEDFKKYEATMLHDIQDKFQYYQYLYADWLFLIPHHLAPYQHHHDFLLLHDNHARY